MFCAKCGTQISTSQQFCPNCGAKNDNYIEEKKVKIPSILRQTEMETKDSSDLKDKSISGNRKKIILALVIIAIIIVGIVAVFLFGKSGSAISVKNEYKKNGATAYVSDDGDAGFLIDGEIVKFSGDIKSAKTTPDYSKYIVLNNSGELSLYTDPSGEAKKLAENVSWILAVNNQGAFIEEESTEELKFCFFDSNDIFEIGFKDYSTRYSENKMSVAGVDPKGKLYVYTVGDEKVRELCHAGEDIEICAVANKGDNVIWSDEKEENICVYMMQNGAPERIGKLGKPEKYNMVYGDYFDGGKSYIVYAAKSSKMLLSINGEYPKEINIDGIKCYGQIMDQNGQYIYSESSRVESFYFSAWNNKDDRMETLYHMDLDGTVTEIAPNLDVSENWDYHGAEKYYFANGKVFYLDKDGDLFVKKEDDKDSERITTDVDAVYVPSGGRYVYLVKFGSLYYWDVSDKDHKLNVISTNYTTDDSVYLTDKDDVIYYITETMDIKYVEDSESKDTFENKGMLQKYTVGGDNEQISDNIMGFWMNDAECVRAEFPVIRKYVKTDGRDVIEEIGTIHNGAYNMVLENVR